MIKGVNIGGVQFHRAGKIYDFSYTTLDLRIRDQVVVETERGLCLATVVRLGFRLYTDGENLGLKPILRKATAKELTPVTRLTPEEVVAFTEKKVAKFQLKMRVLKGEIQFGGNKVIIYFSAPGRVDFRELVKELAGGLKSRVELKQVGARDETKLLGGIGVCGREYCCSSFLREFVPVSIKMAKNQNLALNPQKVSGGCGRLLCCLTYENDVYSELRQIMPPRGTRVRILANGDKGTVLKSDLLNQTLLVETEFGSQVSAKIQDVAVEGERSSEANEADTWGDDIHLEDLV
ncbi:MAG: stage 0 sporulation protein [Deltaproteobacteria bacterium]|nr:stage 0 sporulation protein [Deltaproteobacteria bacterium]